MSGDGVFRSGLVSFVGRPNVGKSTLLNALVGGKVAITSSKPQTTRHVIRGVLHRPDGQVVVVDTPGVHRPRTPLGKRLNDLVGKTWAEVDAVGLCLPADEATGPGDRFVARAVAAATRRPVLAIVTKTDRVTPGALAERLAAVAALAGEAGLTWRDVVPVSARSGHNLDILARVLLAAMPPGPPMYPEGQLTDEPERVLVAEFVREAALERVNDELPHSIAVTVDEMIVRADRPADRPLTEIYASLFVERDSQKPIVLGPGGAQLRAIGEQSRRHIEALLGTQVYLDLRIKVAKEWQRDPRQMRRVGFD